MKASGIIKRFDMQRKPVRQRGYLRPLTWLLSFPSVWKRRLRISRSGMEGLRPPYLLLCNHNAFIDFKVTTAAIFPHRANYVVAIDGFIGREWLLRQVGGICKRKFTNDMQLVRHIHHVLHEQKDILALYPEARYTLDGSQASLPGSLGKMIRMMKVPVVLLLMHGNHLQQPVWNLKKRNNRIDAELTCLFTAEQARTLTVEEINRRLSEAFRYDEYAWQRENRVRIDAPDRAEGLHNVLYQCPACLCENRMESQGHRLRCGACGKQWALSEYGALSAETGETEYASVPAWFRFERAQVRNQLLAGTYRFEDDVTVDWLPNARGYIRLGTGHLIHDAEGFRMTGNFDGKPFELVKEPRSMYACHIEYNYFGKGDCIDLSTLEDTWYLYPRTARTAVTKISLAVEELYLMAKEREETAKPD